MFCQKHHRKEAEVRHFQRIFQREETTWWGNRTLAGQFRKERRWKMIINYIKPKYETKVLELGCGEGIDSSRLAKTGARITAVDISSNLIEIAKQNSGLKNVEFRISDVDDLPFQDDYFDAVVGNSILHHLELDDSLKEIRRVLEKGGKIAFCEPNLLNPQIFLERKIKPIGKILQVSPFETAFTRWSLKRSLECAGFSKVVVEPFDFLHPAISRALIKPICRLGLVIEGFPLIRELAGSLFIRAIL